MELILTLLTGPQSGHMIRVKGSRLIIGRGQGSKIRIPSGSVSRSHSLITWQKVEGGYYLIEDMGSTNGTFINAIQVLNPVVLLPGDDLFVGSIGFRVHYTMKPKSLKNLAEMRSSSGYPAPGAPPIASQAMAVEDIEATEPHWAGLATEEEEIPMAEVIGERSRIPVPLSDEPSAYIAVEDLDSFPQTPTPSSDTSYTAAMHPEVPAKANQASDPDLEHLFAEAHSPIPFRDEHNELDLDDLETLPNKPLPPPPPAHRLDNQFDSDDDNGIELSNADLVLPRDMHLAELARILREDSDASPAAVPPPPPPPRKNGTT